MAKCVKVLVMAMFAMAITRVEAQQKFDALQLLSDIKTLSSDEFEGRKVGTEGSNRAQEYIIKRFVDYKLIPFDGNYKQEFKFSNSRYQEGKEITGYNIVGYIKGKKFPNTFMAISGHYDHLGERNGEIFNGADDNASGVAGMFSIAEYYKKNTPDYSIAFIAFDAEEWGLQGAKAFVNNPPFPIENLVTMVNIDMISISKKNELYAVGTYHYPFLKPYLDSIKDNNQNVAIRFGHDQPKENNTGQDDWTYASDHGPFHKAGIPFIYFGVEDHQHYHRPTDTFDKIDQVFFINSVDLVIDYMVELDKNLGDVMVEKEKKRAKENK